MNKYTGSEYTIALENEYFELVPEFLDYLKNYIGLHEVEFHREMWKDSCNGALSGAFRKIVKEREDMVMLAIPDALVDRVALSFIISELMYIKLGSKRRQKQLSLDLDIWQGIEEVFETLKLYQINPYNIASIDIQLRKKDPLPPLGSMDKIDEKELKRRERGAPKIKIQGSEAMGEILKLIRRNKSIFEDLQIKHAETKRPGDRVMKQTNWTKKHRLEFGNILALFFEDQVEHRNQSDVLFWIGQLLWAMELMPTTHYNDLDPIDAREQMIDTLKKDGIRFPANKGKK